MNILEQLLIWEMAKSNLKKENNFPKLIQFGRIADFHVVSASDTDVSGEIIQLNSVTGMSKSLATARLKCISEWKERRLISVLAREKPEQFKFGSDGCAAFPLIPWRPQSSSKLAKINALGESMERYIWLKWWRDCGNAEELTMTTRVSDKMFSTLHRISKRIKPDYIQLFRPSFKGCFETSDFEVLVVYLKLKGLGFISAGAAGLKNETQQTIFKAMSELYRHFIGIHRAVQKGIKSSPSEYENRLIFFGLGMGNELVEERISNINSGRYITLPRPNHFSIISSGFCFHQSRFDGHDKFITAEKELCL